MGWRDYCNVRANAGDGRAMMRYMARSRTQDRGTPGEQTRPVAGDEESFRETLRWRERKGREVAYVSVVVSPERADLDLPDGDWRRLARLWTDNCNGREERHVAYVHRDTDHAHLHVAVARGYYSREELERNKEQTREIVRERERERDQERAVERLHEREMERTREHERRQERQQEREREREDDMAR